MDATRRHQTTTDLARLLSRVERGIAARLGAVLEPAGSSVEQWRVLCLLADGAGHPMNEIADYASLPPPTLTKIVDRMVSANLVYRRADSVDRRRVLVHMSARGRASYRRLAGAVEREWEALTGHLGEEQVAHLGALLEQLATGVRRPERA